MFLAWKKLKKFDARMLLLNASLDACAPPRPVMARHIAKNAIAIAARVLNTSDPLSRSINSAASSAFTVVSRLVAAAGTMPQPYGGGAGTGGPIHRLPVVYGVRLAG